ncbi:MAG: hypothetical protein P8N51_04140 [Pseudomonadales bacterium]|jgi:hypothetical protein|nr:hypothetical protein [Pseudomonadales bacterium]MDG1441393.1 hypothetical protein [Pseudomonadales bacterium]
MRTLYIVRSNPLEGREADFNQWYSDIHLPEVMKIEGFLSANRFKLADVQVVTAQAHGYMVIYEIDSNDVPGTLRNLRQATWLNMGDSIDLASLDISIFESIE